MQLLQLVVRQGRVFGARGRLSVRLGPRVSIEPCPITTKDMQTQAPLASAQRSKVACHVPRCRECVQKVGKGSMVEALILAGRLQTLFEGRDDVSRTQLEKGRKGPSTLQSHGLGVPLERRSGSGCRRQRLEFVQERLCEVVIRAKLVDLAHKEELGSTHLFETRSDSLPPQIIEDVEHVTTYPLRHLKEVRQGACLVQQRIKRGAELQRRWRHNGFVPREVREGLDTLCLGRVPGQGQMRWSWRVEAHFHMGLNVLRRHPVEDGVDGSFAQLKTQVERER